MIFAELVQKSLKVKNSKEINFKKSMTLKIENEYMTFYAATISHRDILLHSENCIVQYLVDIYGDRPVAVLHDIIKD